jgi:membrane protease YdiL (CAAX protease family)
MFCPDCGSEYRPGFSRCADCELDLVDELPPAPEPEEPLTLATVYATGDRALLARAKSRLDQAGIPYLTQGEGQHDLFDQGGLDPGARAEPMEIQVGSHRWRQAEALLRRADLEPVEATPEEQRAGEEWEDEEKRAAEAVAPAPASPPRAALAEDRLRAWELALVLLVAFSSPVISSALDWWTGSVGPGTETVLGSVYGIKKQAICLGLLAYVLSRRGRTFRDLGLTFRWADVPAGVLLTVAAFLARSLAWRGMEWTSLLVTGRPIAYVDHREHLAGLGLILLSLLYRVIDPIYEEMIARAFTLTEVEALTGSTGLAIAASVLLQTSYHFYLGTASAVSAGAMFLVYACFYARFRRITPVILAHAIWDVMLIFRVL